MGKAEKIRDKAKQAAEQAKAKAAQAREEASERAGDPRQLSEEQWERAQQAKRNAGSGHS
ncbi:hypothetical protein ACIQ9Q_18610 [Streptomyces sp. NPDC094438]|uniref:hypothetical protein n=1 Tax=Streptomyces sp. NPDC094438 TaxID=3366061 RepID=UPI003811AF33